MLRKAAISFFIALVVTSAIIGLHQLRGFDSLLDGFYGKLMTWLAAPGAVGRGLVPSAAFGIVGGLAFIASWIMLSVPQTRFRVRLLAMQFLVVLGCSATLALYGFMFEPVSSVIAITLAVIVSVFFTSTASGQRRLALQEVVGGRVSASLFEKLCASPTAVVADAGLRDVTVLTVRVFHREVPAAQEIQEEEEEKEEDVGDDSDDMDKVSEEGTVREEDSPDLEEEAGSDALDDETAEVPLRVKLEEAQMTEELPAAISRPEPPVEPASQSKVAPGPGLVELTNTCLRESSHFLLGAGGYLDDASPDCVRVFFGLAQEDDNHAVTACRAALDLRERLESKFGSAVSLDFGIALNTGLVHAGVFQTGKSRFFTGVGGDVDFTRRLSVANLTYGTRILLGAGTHQRVADAMEVRPIDMLFVPEAEVMLEVCELLASAGSIGEEALERRDAFWKGVISYREGDYEAAAGHFEKADPGDGRDLPLNYYRQKVEQDLQEADASAGEGNRKRPRRSHARLANTI